MTLRVLHGPENIAGNPACLAKAERALGLQSRLVTVTPHVFGYPADETLLPAGAGPAAEEIARWRLLRRSLREADVIHFNFGKTFTPDRTHSLRAPADEPLSTRILRPPWTVYTRMFEQRDLPLLKRRHKGIVVTFQGDDARQGDYIAKRYRIHPVEEMPPGFYTPRTDAHKRRRIGRFARWADRIFALNPDLLRVLPEGAEFLPYANVDPRGWQPAPPSARTDQPPLVLHAPTNRELKGTRFILDAVAALRREGVPFRFRLVEGLAHEQAKRLYQEADLVVDQLLLGWYGGLAVELMALGKPVIAYVRDEDLDLVPPGLARDLPIIQATPGTLTDVLRSWLTERRTELGERGRAGRRFVERWHDPIQIARTTRAAYEEALS